MSVMIYISGTEMQVAVGSGSGKNTRIQKSYVVPTPEGSVINGTVMDADAFVPFLKSFFLGNKLPVSDVNLVVNSTKIAGKQLDIPEMGKNATREYISREFADMDRDENEDVCSYTPLKGGKENRLKRVYAENVSKEFVNDYLEIFKEAGIKLKGIYSSEGCLIKLVEMTAAQMRRTFVVQVAEGNLLSSVVWVGGVFYYYNSQRCFQNVGTAEYFNECSRTIDQIGQFMKANQITVPLDTIFVGGMEKTNAEYYMGVLRDNTQGTVIDSFDSGIGKGLAPGTDVQQVLMAVCGLMARSNTNNLLKAFSKETERKDNVTRFRIILVLSIFVIMLAALLITLKLRFDAEKKLDALVAYNENPNMMASLMDYDLYSMRVSINEKRKEALYNIGEAFETYPALTTPIYKELEKRAVGYADIEIQSFDANAGLISFTVSAREVEDINIFIADLMKSDAFIKVEYTGYSFDESIGIWNVHVSCIMDENVGREEH